MRRVEMGRQVAELKAEAAQAKIEDEDQSHSSRMNAE